MKSPNIDFIGIDSVSNLPFLLFVLTPLCVQFQLVIGVALLFNETGNDKTIIAELIFMDRIYTINHALDVKSIAHFTG